MSEEVQALINSNNAMVAQMKADQEQAKNNMAILTAGQEEMKNKLDKSMTKVGETIMEMKKDVLTIMDKALAQQDTKLDVVNTRMAKMEAEFALLAKNASATSSSTRAAAAAVDAEGDHTMGSGVSTPILQDPKKRKGVPLLGPLRGSSLPPLPRNPTAAPETRSSGFAIFVGGWERPVAAHVRKTWHQANTLTHIPVELLPLATFKAQPMKTHFSIVFEDKEDRDTALEEIKKQSFTFDDVNYGKKYNIYTKVERSFEIRQVGKFRHHFHEALENYFDALGLKEAKFQKGSFKLHWANGQIFINVDNDDHLLMSFARGIPKDSSEIEANYPQLNKFYITDEQADMMIASALLKAESLRK